MRRGEVLLFEKIENSVFLFHMKEINILAAAFAEIKFLKCVQQSQTSVGIPGECEQVNKTGRALLLH